MWRNARRLARWRRGWRDSPRCKSTTGASRRATRVSANEETSSEATVRAFCAWVSLHGGPPALEGLARELEDRFSVPRARLLEAALCGGRDASAAAILDRADALLLRGHAGLASAHGCDVARARFARDAIVTPEIEALFGLHDALRAGKRVSWGHPAWPQHALLLAERANTRDRRKTVRQLLRRLLPLQPRNLSLHALKRAACAAGMSMRGSLAMCSMLSDQELDCALTHDQPRVLGPLASFVLPSGPTLAACAERAVSRGAVRCLAFLLSVSVPLPSLRLGFFVPRWAGTNPAGLARVACAAQFVAAAVGSRASPFASRRLSPRCGAILAAPLYHALGSRLRTG